MHGTRRQVTDEEFLSYKLAIERARKVEKRHSQLYMRILSVVEDKVGREMLLNICTISKAIGVDITQVSKIISEHRPLARIISQHQRRHGWTLTRRRAIQGPFVPCNL